MYTIIRRYESVDKSRTDEFVKKAQDSLVPTLSGLAGFHGYSLVDAGNGVVTSIGFFDTSAQADESTRVASTWLSDQKLMTAFPKAPKITSGNTIVHEMRELAKA